MDDTKARLYAAKYGRSTVGGWQVAELINHGKSAAVFRGKKGTIECALKLFDTELVETHGTEAQSERVQRERTLIGHSIPNLVAIFDAGRDADTGLFYIAMEFLNWRNIADCLNEIPANAIRPILGQLAATARALENRSIAHRDIKPSNIAISSDFREIRLLDLGVLRPIGTKSEATDHGHPRFVGTQQYSPPEFLFREESDDIQGWRAVTYYQIGGVLYDLLERRPLFAEHAEPYTRMVRAIRETSPTFTTSSDQCLQQLAKDCLHKDAQIRLKLVNWERLGNPDGANTDHESKVEQARTRLGASEQPSSQQPPPSIRLSDTVQDALAAACNRLRIGERVVTDQALKDGGLVFTSIRDSEDEQRFAVAIEWRRPTTTSDTLIVRTAIAGITGMLPVPEGAWSTPMPTDPHSRSLQTAIEAAIVLALEETNLDGSWILNDETNHE